MIEASENRLRSAASGVAAFMRKHRVMLLVLATLIFMTGVWWSIESLDFDRGDLNWRYILIIAIVLAPASMIYAAASFVIMAKGAGTRVSFAKSIHISCVAQLAEFLPLPGGAIVRGGALMQLGSNGTKAAAHVTVNAILWVGCATLAAGASFGLHEWAGIILLPVGSITVLACFAWLLREAGALIALAATGIRIIGLLISALRIGAAFLAISITLDFAQIYPFTFATILGSASSVAPGGLGIGETLAAFMATLTSVEPAAAFLAVGLNRVLGLLVSGILTGAIVMAKSNTAVAHG